MHTDQKGKNKTVHICKCHDCLCRKSKDIIKKSLELISEFSKVRGHKINMQKSFVLLYTSCEHMGTEIKNKILFTIRKKEILRVHETKHVHGLYAKSHV